LGAAPTGPRHPQVSRVITSAFSSRARIGAWLRANGPMFDWDNPAWARTGRGGPFEPWHWEYVPGVKALVAAGLE